MQHCIDLSDPSLCKYLKFAVAPVHTASLPYQFSIIEGGEFPPYQRYGSIERSKFCHLAIVGEEEEENGGSSNEERNGEEDEDSSGDEGGKGKGQTTGGEGQGAGQQEGGTGGAGVEHQQQKEDKKQLEDGQKQEEKNKQDKEEHISGGRAGPESKLQEQEGEQHIEEQPQVVCTESAELGSHSTIGM